MSAARARTESAVRPPAREPARRRGDLTRGPVSRRLAALWLPMVGGVLAVKSIDLADAFFVAQLGGDALAAITFSFPVVLTLISIAIGLSAGASSVLSRAVGAGADEEEQARVVVAALTLTTAVCVVLAIAGIAASRLLMQVLGADGAVLDAATLFLRVWFVGLPFLARPIVINGLLRATGDGSTPALLLVGTAAANVALDALLIFGWGPVPGFGLLGAAIATVIVRAGATAVSLGLLHRRGLLPARSGPDGIGALPRVVAARWRAIADVAFPASIASSLNPVALSIATAAVATLGEAEVAAFGIATKVQGIACVPLLALSAAIAPVAGQSSSAGDIGRTRHALRWCAAVGAGWSALVAAVLLATGETLVANFSVDPAIRDAAYLYLVIVPLSYCGYGIVIAIGAAMNGLGRSITALAVGGGRAMLLLAPGAWIGASMGGFGGVAIATAVTNALAGLVGFALLRAHPLTIPAPRRIR